MTLDDLFEDVETYPVGSVSSRMKGESIPVSDDAWVQMLVSDPYIASSVLAFSSFDDSEHRKSVAKKLVELLDKVVQNEVSGVNVSDGERDTAQHERDEIVERYLE